MMKGLIFGDSLYEVPRTSIARTSGGHRIATLLRKQGVDVEVVDFFNSWSLDELKKIVDSCSLDFIGFSLGLGKLDYEKTNQLITYTKECNKDIKVIVGGAHSLDEGFDGIDLYFKGFAEEAIPDLIEYFETGIYRPDKIETIMFPTTKHVINCNKHYPAIDLTKLRNEYTDNDFLSSRENLGLEVSRGCIFKCKFCSFALIGKNKNDYIRDKEDIKQEIIDNYNKWGITNYSITDDTFNDNEIKVDYLYEISQEVDFDLSFMAYIRVDLLRAKPGSLDKMMKAGFKGMHFGIETLSLETSKSIGKGFTGEPLKAYLREIKDKYPNLNITSSFIIGLPNESYEQAAANIHEIVAEKLVDSAPLYPLGIPKKAEMHTDLSEFSLTWDKHGYEELTVEEATKLLELPKYSMFKGIDLEVRSFSEVIWKNSHMNVFDAWLYTSKLKQEIHSSTNISGWHCFAASSDDITVDQRLGYTRLEWDWNSVKQSTEEFVQNYKRNKMAVFNN